MESKKRKVQGIVIKFSNSNTAKVRVETKKAHPLYGKTVKSHKNYSVHIAEQANVNVGDVVTIVETKPISKNKTWVLEQ